MSTPTAGASAGTATEGGQVRDVRREPFVVLADLAHDRALVTWGAFYFVRHDADQRWAIVEDHHLADLVDRRSCIGTEAEPFGDTTVEVMDSSGAVVAQAWTAEHTWVWVEGLEPDTEYHYRVSVDGECWGEAELWDTLPDRRGGYDLMPSGRTYDLRFRTWPHPDNPSPPLQFVALGDYGVGIRSDSESTRRQRRIAEVLDQLVTDSDMRFVISLGDNIYEGEIGEVGDNSGGEDDDWYSSYYAPYRYALAQIPFFPAIGNHDTSDTEFSDDRAQLEDNFHLQQRFGNTAGRSSVDPGLFYRLRYGRDVELVAIDTSVDSGSDGEHRHFQAAHHRQWLQEVFATDDVRWRIPFSHHPAYCAGPKHPNDQEICEELTPLFATGGVRLVLAGHEHNFQISEVDGRTYAISGAGGKIREESPEDFEQAGTTAWSGQSHLLLVEIDGEEARLTPISGLLPDGTPHLMTAMNPQDHIIRPPFVITENGVVPTSVSTNP
ncbi:purple acid phosphatase family protein [Ornithinicoccus halotolerans]|uniref:purple acid phosphatase family protein n=1 Tax=Ornithinicoccus halotolerans TaxID=1748220 RepID=UPI001296FBCB|nr:metallophosphoesterase family protein [Ornithinicoccus halotolerans]